MSSLVEVKTSGKYLSIVVECDLYVVECDDSNWNRSSVGSLE